MSALVVTRIGPGASVQDLGRPGRMHEGIPPGGALVPELLAATNRSIGNAPSAAAIELPLHGATLRAEGPLVVSIDGVPRTLADGEELRVEPAAHAVRYVALPGGIDVPIQLGGRGTLPVARLGGLDGRFLVRGDVLRPTLDEATPSIVSIASETSRIRIVVGPDDLGEEALRVLLSATFTLSATFDRTGQRLDGARLPVLPDRRASAPMVRGAIQITLDGTPIVLGPDHPTTGGYPVIAVVVSHDLGALACQRPGAAIRFEAIVGSLTLPR